MTKEKLNLGEAFEKLKSDDKSLFRAAVEAEMKVRGTDEFRYAYAYGQLSAAVKGYLYIRNKMDFDEINTIAKNNLEQK